MCDKIKVCTNWIKLRIRPSPETITYETIKSRRISESILFITVPVILQFDRLPQLLLYPKTSSGFKVKKSIVYDMNYEINFKNVLKWVIASLGMIKIIWLFLNTY